METLALAHRPRRWDDLVGQRVVQVVLRQMVAKDRIPTALLLDGSHGTGKTTSLRILAAATACETPPDPCGHCAGCTAVFTGTSPNLIEIDAASHGLVDDIRALNHQLRFTSAAGWRFIGLDEAQSMSAAAYNALLKILEEPPPRTSIVLLTTDPGKIPDTIISRCMRFTFQPLPVADIVARLTHITEVERIDTDPALLHLIADRSRGALRDAIMVLDQVSRVGVTTTEQFTDLFGDTDPGPALLTAIRTGDACTAYQALDAAMDTTGDPATVSSGLAHTLRDICILHGRGTPTARGRGLEERQRLASTMDTRTAVSALKVLWDYVTRIRPGDDRRTALELAVAALTDLFTLKTAAPAGVGNQGSRSISVTGQNTLTFADMAAMR